MDNLETELKACSIQVLHCMKIQNIDSAEKQSVQPSPLKIQIETGNSKKPVKIKTTPLK